ncbi:disease resistance protein RUN1-like isoform X1 [Malus sylvestris]|nr:disease resistance protein RUN1-like isoform X1 [Malus sylvestris]
MPNCHLMKMASSSSSSSSKSSHYDVFLSFEGETRKTFTDHLSCTLELHGFNVFPDKSKLPRGETITEEQKQGIKDSRLAAIIFSSGYAESRWCLQELVEILARRTAKEQIVLPIFYSIEPTDVNPEKGDFEKAFRKHQKRFPEMVETWKKALNEAAALIGLDFRQTDGHEGLFVRTIVDEITKKLENTYLFVAPNPVGIDPRVQEVGKYLDVERSDDVRIIGILGTGGLGKTTVAKEIFNKYQDRFEGAGFLASVSEDEKLVDSQNTLLSDVLRTENIKVSRADEGTSKIKSKLGKLRTLVIIDDVDKVKQLDALGINRNSFGRGSRIVITTRNEHVLQTLKADIYHLPAMNEEESLELLSWRAFGEKYPKEKYHEVSREVVDYCGGLPLALHVLGNFLREETPRQWEDALRKWKRSRPYLEIYERLKMSYDRLTSSDAKSLFLDISCFFIGMNKDYVMKILDPRDEDDEDRRGEDRGDEDTTIGIRELYNQCLVTVDSEGNLRMHGLIRDTGREIVHEKSPEIKGRRCRLWDHKDVMHVLRTETGREEIQGLALDLSKESHKPSFSTNAFNEMHGLRLLKLKDVQFTGNCEDLLKHLSKELRWFCWHGFPLNVIPEDFDHPDMVAVDLSYSKLIRVWEDSDLLLVKWKFLNLSHSHNLTQSPNFSKLPNLEQLILQDCKCLPGIDQSLGKLEKLVKIDFRSNSFCSLPSLSGISKLETLCLNNCTNLQKIPDLPTNLEILEADECIALEKMPDFSEMSRMRVLHLNRSPKLTEIPGLDKSLESMTRIHMEGCTNLTADFRKKILQGWTSCGYGGIFLDGNYIPEWFGYFGGDEVCFVVPQSFSSNFKGLTLCCVYSSDKRPEDCPLGISVRNKTKCTALLAHITYASVPTFCDYEDHYLWQGQLSKDVLKWQEGDEIKIFLGPVGPGDNSAKVKQIAVDLVWDKFMKENRDDSHPDLYDFNPHQDCLAGDDDEARTSHDASGENLPSNILRSDSIDGGDDEAGPGNIDTSDENQTPKTGCCLFFLSKLSLMWGEIVKTR